MVFIQSLAYAVAATSIAFQSVTAVPTGGIAARSSRIQDKHHTAPVVQIDVNAKVRPNFRAGGRRQQPFVKPRDTVHKHVHVHSGLVEVRTPDYDPNHSQHWNFHHGFTNVDGHGHWNKRDLAEEKEHTIEERSAHVHSHVHGGSSTIVQGSSNTIVYEGYNGRPRWWRHGGRWRHGGYVLGEGSLINVSLGKRSPEGEAVEKREPRKSSPRRKHGGRKQHIKTVLADEPAPAHKKSSYHKKTGSKSKGASTSKSGFKKTSKKGKKVQARNTVTFSYQKRHHDEEWWKAHRHEHMDALAIDVHGNLVRRDGVAGVPGFVEVASQLFHSTLAKSVAGLVYSKDPDSNSSFVLGTSSNQSTQFFMAPTPPVNAAPVNGTDGSDALNGTQINMVTPPSNFVQLRVPILNSETMKTSDYCATFNNIPPSPLSLEPCGDIDGFSQDFSYNSTTGEISPVYGADPDTGDIPTPVVKSVEFINGVDAQSKIADGTPANATSNDDDTPSNVALFFVPASLFYEQSKTVSDLEQARQAVVNATSSDAVATSTDSAAVPSSTDSTISTSDDSTPTDSFSVSDSSMPTATVTDDMMAMVSPTSTASDDGASTTTSCCPDATSTDSSAPIATSSADSS